FFLHISFFSLCLHFSKSVTQKYSRASWIKIEILTSMWVAKKINSEKDN
ncbi:hypothetical protein LINGRAPRIM_LOCUS1905, partial [Linum grandiflorum]